MARVRQGGSQRWRERAAAAGGTYSEGVTNPRRQWQQATAAAAANYQAGIQAAITAKSFEKGVAKAGNEKWASRARDVGASRFVQGVQGSENAYASGIQKYLGVIEQTQLPPRFPRGDPRNLDRVAAIANALRKAKLAG